MLPTPDTSHVPYGRVYEPAEDSFLLMDTLAEPPEAAFLQARFAATAPLVVEIGAGSGVVLAFVAAQAALLFGATTPPLALAVDINAFACAATTQTVRKAIRAETSAAVFGGAVRADLASALRPGQVDMLLFNPPYVPTPALPANEPASPVPDDFARDSHLLELAYAGGRDGMETTDRLLEALPAVLSDRGCAYLLLCAQNRPDAVKERIRTWPVPGASRRWHAETVGSSGQQAGWEKLQIVRIWRE